MKNKDKIISILIPVAYLLIAFFCIRKFLFIDGILGYRHDWPSYYCDLRYLYNNAMDIWQSRSLGELLTYGGAQYLINFVIGGISIIGISSIFISKITIIFLIFLSAMAMYLLMRSLKLARFASFISGLIFALSPLFFNNLISGYLWYLFSYALSPLVLLFFIKAIDSENNKDYYKNIVISGLMFSLAISQIHFLPMILLIMVIYLLFSKGKIIRSIYAILLIGLIVSIVHLPWILPTLLESQGKIGQLSSSASVLSWNKNLSPNIENELFLTAFYANRYFIDIVTKNNGWQIISIFIPVLAFLALIINKSKKVLYFALISILGIFLAKGIKPPLESVSDLIYTKLHLLSIFRQSYHFMFLPTIGFSVLIGFTIEKMIKLLKNTITKILFALLVLIIIAVYSYPILSGNFSGQLETYKPDKVYDSIYDKLKTDSEDYRVLWLPAIGPTQQNNLQYSINFDPMIEYSPKKSFSSEGGILFFNGSSTVFRNFILYDLYNNIKTENFGKILSLADIKTIYERKDYNSIYPSISNLGNFPLLSQNWTNDKLDQKLSNQKGIEFTQKNGPINIYNNLENKGHIYGAQKPLLTSNNLSILDSSNINNYDAFIFADQNNSATLKNISIDKNSDQTSLAVSNLNKYALSPADYANNFFNAKDGWIKGNYWFWYDKNFSNEINDFVFSLKNDQLNIPVTLDGGNYKILIKYYQLQPDGDVKLKIDNQQININLQTKNDFNWQDLGNYQIAKGKHTVNLSTNNGNVAVEKIVIVPQEEYNKAILDAKTLIENNSVAQAKNSVNYTKINQTKYAVDIENNNPFYLIFSENYDPNWKLLDINGKEIKAQHLIVNGYANAFYFENTGQQKIFIEFKPQKYHNLGLIISISTLIILIGLIIYAKKNFH